MKNPPMINEYMHNHYPVKTQTNPSHPSTNNNVTLPRIQDILCQIQPPFPTQHTHPIPNFQPIPNRPHESNPFSPSTNGAFKRVKLSNENERERFTEQSHQTIPRFQTLPPPPVNNLPRTTTPIVNNTMTDTTVISMNSPISSYSSNEDSNDDKERKRREQTIKREQDRRSRMNHHLDALKEILLKENQQDLTSELNSKLTKEGILIEAIQFIRKLKEQAGETNLPKVTIMDDPFNRQAITQDEIDAGFTIMFTSESKKLAQIQSYRQLQVLLENFNKVSDLAKLSCRDEHKLSSYVMYLAYHTFLECKPEKIIEIYHKAIPLYTKIKKQGCNSQQLMYMNTDVKVFLTSTYSLALLMDGYVDQSKTLWEKTLKTTRKLNHHGTTVWVQLFYRAFANINGDDLDISLANKVRRIVNNHPMWKGMAEISYFASILEDNHSTELDKQQALDAIKRNMELMDSSSGSISKSALCGAYIYYLAKFHPERALEEFDMIYEVFDKVKIYSTWSVADLKRLKAHSLIALGKSAHNNEHVENLLEECVEMSKDASYPCSVKCLTLMVKYLTQKRDDLKLNMYKSRLINLYEKRSKNFSTEAPAYIKQAKNLLETVVN